MVFKSVGRRCCGRRVVLVLMERFIKTGPAAGLAVAWWHAVEVKEGAPVPDMRRGDEEERENQGRQPAVEMRGVRHIHHLTEGRQTLACLCSM